MRYLSFVLLLLIFGCQENYQNETAVAGPEITPIIPVPAEVNYYQGELDLSSGCHIELPNDWSNLSDHFNQHFKTNASGVKVILEKNKSAKAESYTLEINRKQIEISAPDPAGAFYALMTLRQLMSAASDNKIPCQNITDAPRFAYRGMHLDVCRHMFPVDFIKKYIDLLALHKMNTFHWHLTEDQGWRIEIKKYPKLQTIAAFRDETKVGHFGDKAAGYDGKRYGGFYSQEQAREIVAYATDRFITVIPEIEMPGHARAALAAYPELGCSGGPYRTATTWGVFDEVYCPNEKTFEFLENVLTEVMDIFPSEYIHIGGDECPKKSWEDSPFCQQLIKKEGLKDEHELQSYFITRMEKFINAKGRQIIGWDEILEGGLAPNATVMSWRGIAGGIEAAKQKHDVIMTPTTHCYLDYYQAGPEGEPLAIGGFLTLEKVYSFEPVPEELNPEEQKHILGVQGNVWTEYMPTVEQAEYMAYPRAIAIAENGWSQKEAKDYSNFKTRLKGHLKILDEMNVNYCGAFIEQ